MAVFTDILSVVVVVLLIVAWWKIFQKAGEKGWKSIIPIYNEYILYKISWKSMMFWIVLVLGIAGEIMMMAGGATFAADGTLSTPGAVASSPLVIIGSIICIAAGIIEIIKQFKLSKAFGHGVGFALGLIFLSPIFELILGFGSSEYRGPQD